MIRVLLPALLLLAPLPLAAQTAYPVDDSGSRVIGGPVRMHWDEPQSRRQGWQTVSGELAVNVRLNVSPWQGRAARIYMILPAQPAGRIDVSWTTQGALLPGSMRDGERRLVYAGMIPGPLIEDTQHLLLRADGDRLTRVEQLQFSFEIEVESP